MSGTTLAPRVPAVRLGPETKGFHCPAHVDAAEFVAASHTLFDGGSSFPVMTLDRSAMTHNIEQLAVFAKQHQMQLAPHGKTTMAPAIFAAQLGAGVGPHRRLQSAADGGALLRGQTPPGRQRDHRSGRAALDCLGVRRRPDHGDHSLHRQLLGRGRGQRDRHREPVPRGHRSRRASRGARKGVRSLHDVVPLAT